MEFPDKDEIRSLCTQQSFQRGQAYYERGHVSDLVIGEGEIRGTVQGTHAYEISIQLTEEGIHTTCSCPYDYVGDCKHIVATLLAAAEREAESTGQTGSAEVVPHRIDEIEELIGETPTGDLRRFLRDVLAEERHLRERFVAFAGAEPTKTVQDYRADIDREFDAAADRHGFVDDRTWINFSQYHDLAETHRERGNVQAATAVYRSIAEAICDNLDRIDDSSGHYGGEIERALTGYAETILEADLDHGRKRPHIEYLCRAFVEDEYGLPGDQYEEALHTICTSRADLELWRDLLESAVPGIAPDEEAVGRRRIDEAGSDTTAPFDVDFEEGRTRSEAILSASDFTHGPLTVEDFVGETLDIEHPAVGPLDVRDFAGDAFEDFIVDEETTVEAHTITGSNRAGKSAGDLNGSFQTRRMLSTYMAVLEKLGADEKLEALFERTYLESPRFCAGYARRLIEADEPERAQRVLEEGLDTFQRPVRLRRLAADLYRERDPDQYRETLERLFLDHGEWDAYDELKASCAKREWAGFYEDWIQRLRETDRAKLVHLYLREEELDAAFEIVTTSDQLEWMKRYREQLGEVDPETYFERYRELLVPFAAGEIGRRHYRTIAHHLEHMRGLVAEDRFDEFVDQLKETHSNRPAFLNELQKAGF